MRRHEKRKIRKEVQLNAKIRKKEQAQKQQIIARTRKEAKSNVANAKTKKVNSVNKCGRKGASTRKAATKRESER